MPERIGLIDVIVVVFPVARAGVVRRVDIDHVHVALVGIEEELKGVEVVGIDEHVPGLVRPAPRHAINRHKSRIDGIAKAANDDEIENREVLLRVFG